MRAVRVRAIRMAGVAVVSVSLLLTGCGSSDDIASVSQDTSKPQFGGNVVDLQNFAAGEPDHIDPALANDTPSMQISSLLFDGLMEVDGKGAVANGVAQSATPNDDATVWTFQLKPNVLFANGDRVTPSDFKTAWERVVNPALASPNASKFAVIKSAAPNAATLDGVVADDAANTLTVRLNYSFRDFPALVSTPPFAPVPSRVIRALPDVSTWEKDVIIGNGPFTMREAWAPGKPLKLQRNESYYGGPEGHPAYLDSVEFRASQGVDAAFTEFERGAGSVGRIPAGRYVDAQKQYGDNVVNTPTLGVEYWGFNLANADVGGPENLKLRQAIAVAIDKADINEKVYGGSRQVATGWAPPGIPGYQGDKDASSNVERARDLLREYGKTPPPIKISFNGGAGHEDKASIIQQNLAEVGITATTDPLDNQSYRRAVGTGQLQFFRAAWNADFESYDNFLYPLFHSDSIGGDNVFGYRNPEVDSKIVAARGLADPNARYELSREVERIVSDDQVVVPITWTTASLVKASNVRGLQVTSLGFVDYGKVWLSKS